jgi:outer membrane protein assembly factor BamB
MPLTASGLPKDQLLRQLHPMHHRLPLLACTLALLIPSHAENWPAWRGPRGDGSSLEINLPTHWNASSNILWKTPLPGSGHASPIVWKDQILTVSSLPDSQERILLSCNRKTGRIEWQTTVLKSPLENKHGLNSHASSTPATNGKQVFTSFLDMNQMLVAAFNMQGEPIWKTHPGPFSSIHGFCSSPVLYDNLVIVNGDHDGNGYIVALNQETGNEVWRIQRPNNTRSYCTPAIFQTSGRTQMLVSGSLCVTSYNPSSGNPLWTINGPTEQYVASLVYNPKADLFFMTAGFPDHHLLAIRTDGTGDITRTHVAWHHENPRYVSYVPSPVSCGDYFLVVSDPGYACCFEASSGKLMWSERFGFQHASLLTANNLVYFTNDQGKTRVVRPGPTLEIVAENELDEKCFASPACAKGQLFIRGFNHLFCISNP